MRHLRQLRPSGVLNVDEGLTADMLAKNTFIAKRREHPGALGPRSALEGLAALWSPHLRDQDPWPDVPEFQMQHGKQSLSSL